jgi:hypothetical protein
MKNYYSFAWIGSGCVLAGVAFGRADLLTGLIVIAGLWVLAYTARA